MTSRSSLSRPQSPAAPVSSADLVRNDDSRLTDSRPPNNHAGNHAPGGGDSINGSYMDLSTGQTVSGTKTFSGTAIFNVPPQVAEGNLAYHPVRRDDPRMVNARDPNAHATSHGSGGSDPISPASIGAASLSHTHTQQQISVSARTVTPSELSSLTPLSGVALDVVSCTLTANTTVSPQSGTDGQIVRIRMVASGGTRSPSVGTSVRLGTGITDRAMTIPSGQVGVFGLEYLSVISAWVLFSEYVVSAS